MKTSFTPGPWLYHAPFRDRTIYDNAGAPVAKVMRGKRDGQTEDANARLIAAAPDLLAALKMLAGVVDEHGNDPVYTIPVNAARQAIARAESHPE